MLTPDATQRAEAARLLGMFGGADGLPRAIDVVQRQFATIQTRTQLLLTLATITLTITGFSGPKMIESGLFTRVGMATGLVFVLAAVLIMLLSLRVRWLTQFDHPDLVERLAQMIAHRDRKTRRYMLELGLLAIGLASYVAAVIGYLIAA
jgi:hypothetical protein